MISWIQLYLQRHFKILFLVLLGAVIVTFVFTTNTAGGFGGDGRPVVERKFFGHDLGTAKGQMAVFGDARLSVQLQMGAFAGIDDAQVQNYALQRATTLHLADLWNIPTPTDTEITESIKQMRMFAGMDGQFDATAYQSFRESLKTNNGGVREGDILRVISDDLRMDKVNQLVAGPGYVLPSDIKTQLTRTDTTWTIATATANYADFKPDLKPTDAELTAAFEQSGGRYDIPPRVTVDYIDFPATDFISQVNVTEAEVRAFYDANPARFPKPAEAAAPAPTVAPAANPDADFAAVRLQVEVSLKLERARQLAGKAASDLAVALYDAKVTDAAALNTFIAAQRLTLRSMAPFTQQMGPAEFGGSPEIASEAFRLSPSRFASEAVPTPGGAVVLFWKNLEPSRTPTFAEVREKVLADHLDTEKRKRFIELGRTIKSQLEARLQAGDDLEKAAATVSALKLEVKKPEPFSLFARPADLDPAIGSALDRLEKGQLSDMVSEVDKGLFVYAIDKKAPDFAETNPRYIEMRDQLANFTARQSGASVVGEMMEAELARTEPKAP